MTTEINSGWRSILSNDAVYRAVQTFFGEERAKNLILNDYILPAGEDCKVLDMGCGPGNILKFFPDTVRYVGFDTNPDYINAAKLEYQDRKDTTFLHGSSSDKTIIDTIKDDDFDVAIIHGVLHHVPDSVAMELFEIASRGLVTNGRLFVLEPVWFDGQSILRKWVMSKDRGKNIKHIDQWTEFFNQLASHWGDVNVVIRSDLSRLYDLVICDVVKK